MLFANRSYHDEAVSAVISVILMVAITVIIAAVVAAFTFGMTRNIPDAKVLTASISNVDAQHLTVTYYGGHDQSTCVGVRWELTRSDGTPMTSFIMGSSSPTASILTVGNAKTVSTTWSGKKHIVAKAYFSDNTQQIILDTFV